MNDKFTWSADDVEIIKPSKSEMTVAADALVNSDIPLEEKKIAARKLTQMMRDAGMPEHTGLRRILGG